MEKKPIQVTLTLTEEEIKVLKDALITEQVNCDEHIKSGTEFPNSEVLVSYAEQAQAKLPKLQALWHRINDAYTDAKYPLVREGQET